MKFTKAENIVVYENGKKVVISAEEFEKTHEKRIDMKNGRVIYTPKTVIDNETTCETTR